MDKQPAKQIDRQTDLQTDRQTYRQTDRQTDRQTVRQTNRQTTDRDGQSNIKFLLAVEPPLMIFSASNSSSPLLNLVSARG